MRVPYHFWRRLVIPAARRGVRPDGRCRSCPASAPRSTGPRRGSRSGRSRVQPSEFLKLAVLLFCADLLAAPPDGDARPAAHAACRCSCVAVRRRRPVPRPGRPRLGDRARRRSCFVVAFIAGAPLVPMAAAGVGGAVGARAVRRVQPASRRPVHGVPGHRRAQGPPQLPDVPGADRHRHGRPHRLGRRRAASAKLAASCPLAHSDFIFAVIAEELGFIGVDRRARRLRAPGVRSACRWRSPAPDRFGTLLAGGIVGWFVRAGDRSTSAASPG